MTNETLSELLDNINYGFYSKAKYTLRYINSKVAIINVNDKKFRNDTLCSFYDFFLIANKNDNSNEKFVGIILDMETDLHIFIIDKYRKQNYLQETLDSTILPHLSAYKDRNLQKLTFESEKVQQYFVNKLGFRYVSDLKAEKNIEDMYSISNKEEYLQFSDKLTLEEKDSMKKTLKESFINLHMIKRKIAYQKDNTFEVESYHDYLNSLYNEIYDDIHFND